MLDSAYPDFYVNERVSEDDSPDLDYKLYEVSEKNYYKTVLKK